MSNTAQPVTTPEIAVADFIDGQLAIFARRSAPEKRAEIRWWRDRIAHLAKQAPKAEPIPATQPVAA